MFRSRKVNLCIVLLAIIGVTACSDIISGSEEESDIISGSEEENVEPPAFPNLSQAQPDIEVFRNNSSQQFKSQSDPSSFEFPSEFPEQVQQGEAFNQAAFFVLSTVGAAEGFMNIGTQLNQAADQSEYEYEDGVFTWEYSHTIEEDDGSEGDVASVRYEAEPNEDANEVEWRLYVTAQSDEIDVDNELFMSGTTSTDGTSGDWEIYDVMGSATGPVLTFDWTVDDNDDLTTNLTINADGQTVSIDYEETDNMRSLSFTSSTEEFDVVVAWNADTGAGSVNFNGDLMCWDSNLETQLSCQ